MSSIPGPINIKGKHSYLYTFPKTFTVFDSKAITSVWVWNVSYYTELYTVELHTQTSDTYIIIIDIIFHIFLWTWTLMQLQQDILAADGEPIYQDTWLRFSNVLLGNRNVKLRMYYMLAIEYFDVRCQNRNIRYTCMIFIFDQHISFLVRGNPEWSNWAPLLKYWLNKLNYGNSVSMIYGPLSRDMVISSIVEKQILFQWTM